MLTKIYISRNLLNQYRAKSKNNSSPNSFWESRALNAIEELRAKGSEKWILNCYRKYPNIAETAKIYALEIPDLEVRNSRGAIFTDTFKRLLSSSKNSIPTPKTEALRCLVRRFPFMSRYLTRPKL